MGTYKNRYTNEIITEEEYQKEYSAAFERDYDEDGFNYNAFDEFSAQEVYEIFKKAETKEEAMNYFWYNFKEMCQESAQIEMDEGWESIEAKPKD